MMNLEQSIVYDIETFPNCFTLYMEELNGDNKAVWEISEYRDDRKALLTYFTYLASNQTPMIGFNNINFDYPVIHYLWQNPNATYQQLYAKAMSIIESKDAFGHIIWADNRFTPQIDLFKLHHFDNKAKSTSLKALQVNMRLDNVIDMPIEVGTVLTEEQVNNVLIPYNVNDVVSTKEFAKYSMNAMEFRNSLVETHGIDVLNWNDTKIGEQTVIHKLGRETCYDERNKPRQTFRKVIPLKDVIFPYVEFKKPEFQAIKNYMDCQTLTSDDLNESQNIKTKGVFTDLTAFVGGVEYSYGVGGIHGSVERKKIVATDEWLIKDIDVASLYPSIAIANNLHPEHLGVRFVEIYNAIREERFHWQKTKGKKCNEANALKLALNGTYGKSNSMFSALYDPKFTMSITINGQLLLTMLLEWLLDVPTIQVIQANTDGITFYVHKDYEHLTSEIERKWEQATGLILEDVFYSKMFIRDVNNYIAVGTNGYIKLKGAYWTPSHDKYFSDIANNQPPAWHKSFNNVVSTRAAVENMINGTDIEYYIKTCFNPFDFCQAIKTRGSDKLIWGDDTLQKNTRYYVSTTGNPLIKRMPPKGVVGAYKKANGISDAEYDRVMQETGGEWDVRVCTKNKSKHTIRETGLVAGYLTTPVNDINCFNWSNVNYDWYINEAKKLLIL